MTTLLAVCAGGALGSGLRFWVSGWAAERWGETFPIGTLVVNVAGSFVIGAFGTVTGPDGWLVSPHVRTFVMVGVLGGFTTFSSFSWQTLALIDARQWGLACANVALSLALCMAGVWLGQTVGLWMLKRSFAP